jgi:hypothetical protein
VINTQTYLSGPSLATKAYQNLAPKGKTAEEDSADTPSRHQGDYEQAFETSFVPEGATELRMDKARFATDGVGNAIILNDPTGPVVSAVLLQNQPMGDLTLQRSARSRGVNAIVLQRGETVSETPEMTQLQLAMMADMVLNKTDFLTHPQSLKSL